MTPGERRVYRDHVFGMGIRDTPVENPAGYHEHRSTLGGRSSYPHGSPAAGGTPAHVTDLRRASPAVQGYAQLVDDGTGAGAVPHTGAPFTIHERFHQHITGGAVGAPVHDRFRASSPQATGAGYDMYPTTVNHGAGTVTIFTRSTAEPPISPRTQGR